MAIEALSAERHAHLRLRSTPQQHPHFVQVVMAEFAAAANRCPLLITKELETGTFYVGAMFGFKPGECLLEEHERFTPLNVRRDGFFISGDRIAIDAAHPRFSESDGEPLFDASAQPAPALRDVQRVLGQLREGTEKTQTFLRELLELKLIEPIDVSLSFDSGERLRLQGLYTVSRDRLHELPDGAVLRLFRAGYMQHIYAIAGSVGHIAALAAARNRRMAGLP